MKQVFTLLSFCLVGVLGWGQINENFNSGLPNSYTTGSVNLASGTWTVQAVFQESSGNSRGGSGHAARLNDDTNNAYLTTPPLSNGVGTVTFWYRELNSGGGTFELQTSTDGVNYTTQTTQSFSGQSYSMFSYSLDINNSNVTIRVLNDDQSGHLIIDDFSTTAFSSSSNTSVQFASASASVSEGVGTYNICVDITNEDATNATSADIVLNSGSSTGDASDVGSYTTQTVTFPAGSSAQQCATITITDDMMVEGGEDIVFDLSNVSGGNSAMAGTPDQFTLSILDNDAAPIGCSVGTEQLGQGFEGSGSWGYSVSGNTMSLPCITGGGDDVVGEVSSVGTGGNTISPNGGSQFFGGRDIDGDCAGSGGVTLNFSTFTASALTAGSYTLNFDYNAFEWDGGDDISYDLLINSSSVASGIVVDGSGNLSTSGWETESINFNLASGENLDFSITLDQNGDGDWGGLDNIVLCRTSALPITLASFTAKKQNNTTHLTWTTATEINNDYMAVERSADGRTFSEIGRVQGAGTTQQPQDYQYIDQRPLPGLNYYRLKQVDYDGQYEYHKTVVVNFDGELPGGMIVFPTAVKDRLQVQLTTENNENASLQIIGADGRVWRSLRWQEKSGRMELLVADLPAGSYWLRLVDGTQVEQAYFQKL